MISDALRTTLQSALTKYVSSRGGSAAELLHTVQLDDTSRGYLSAARRWATVSAQVAVAAQQSYVLFANTHPKAFAVIDRVNFKFSVASSLQIGMDYDLAFSSLGVAALNPVYELFTNRERDPLIVQDGLFRDLKTINTASVVGLATQVTLFTEDALSHDFDNLGLVVRPATGLVFASSALNTSLFMSIWGRFYEPG